jgi:hypothetical protein
MTKITKQMGVYFAEIAYAPESNEWRGLIFRDRMDTVIAKTCTSDLDEAIREADEMLCFYNNKELELLNKVLPKGWHRDG